MDARLWLLSLEIRMPVELQVTREAAEAGGMRSVEWVIASRTICECVCVFVHAWERERDIHRKREAIELAVF